MNRIQNLFNSGKKDILNIYFTAGYPRLKSTVPTILALEKAGVDLIELGMPYSDPLADGPTIQQSGSQAIKNGMSIKHLFDQLEDIRSKSEIPLVLMGYLNPIMQYGLIPFLDKCKSVGVDGLILPDLPVELYEREYVQIFKQYPFSLTFLITPQTSEERIRKIDTLSDGFIYLVSDASITGKKGNISKEQIEYFKRIQMLDLKNPFLIGFGISNHATYKTVSQYSRGAIIGSAFIRHLSKGHSDINEHVTTFVRDIRQPAVV